MWPMFCIRFLTHPIPSKLFHPSPPNLLTSSSNSVFASFDSTYLSYLFSTMAPYKPKTSTKRKEKTPNEPTNIRTLEATRDKAKEDHRLAKQTRKNYNRYVARGRDFLEDLIASMKTQLQANRTMSRGERSRQDQEIHDLSQAFDSTPNVQSVRALELFITEKCFREGCGGNTASGIHAGFKSYWDKTFVLFLSYYHPD